MKKLILTLLLSISMVFITSCGNTVAKEALEQGENAIQEKQYDKALLAFDLVLDNDKGNKKATDLKNLITKYQIARKEFDENKIDESQKTIESIKFNYSNYVIKEDIEKLESEINKKIELNDEFSKNIIQLKTLCDEGNFEQCEKILTILRTYELDSNQKKILEENEKIIVESQKKINEKNFTKRKTN